MALRPRAVEGGRQAAGHLGTGDDTQLSNELYDDEDDGEDNVAQVLDLRGPGTPEGRG
jgi:hypothetical protein